MDNSEMVLLAEGQLPEGLRFHFAPDGLWVSGGVAFPELPSVSVSETAQEVLDSMEVEVLKVGPSCRSFILERWAPPSVCFSRLDLETGHELLFKGIDENYEDVERYVYSVGFKGHFITGGDSMPYWVYDPEGNVLAIETNLLRFPWCIAGGIDTFAVGGTGMPFFDICSFEGEFVRKVSPIEQFPEDSNLYPRKTGAQGESVVTRHIVIGDELGEQRPENEEPDDREEDSEKGPEGYFPDWDLKYDRQGNLWAETGGKFYVYSPEGEILWKGGPPREQRYFNYWWLDQNGFAWFFYSDDRYAVCAIEEFGW